MHDGGQYPPPPFARTTPLSEQHRVLFSSDFGTLLLFLQGSSGKKRKFTRGENLMLVRTLLGPRPPSPRDSLLFLASAARKFFLQVTIFTSAWPPPPSPSQAGVRTI